jgi:hypothetical protein
VEPVTGECPEGQPCVCRECRNNDDCAQDEFCDDENRCLACSQRRAAGRSGRDAQCPACISGETCEGTCCDGICRKPCSGAGDCVCEEEGWTLECLDGVCRT